MVRYAGQTSAMAISGEGEKCPGRGNVLDSTPENGQRLHVATLRLGDNKEQNFRGLSG